MPNCKKSVIKTIIKIYYVCTLPTFSLCWLFESGYFWRNPGREGRHFSSYPCDSPVEAAFLTYDDIEARKLHCNSSGISIKQNCSDNDNISSVNQDSNNNDQAGDQSLTTTTTATTTTTMATTTATAKATTTNQSRYVLSQNPLLQTETVFTTMSNVPQNVTISPGTAQAVEKEKNTNRLPDGFWIFVGILIMAVPVLLGTILFIKYVKPCFHHPSNISCEDNPIYHEKLTIACSMPSVDTSVDTSNISQNDAGHGNQNIGANYLDFIQEVEQG